MIAGGEHVRNRAAFPHRRPGILRVFEQRLREAFLHAGGLRPHHAGQQADAGVAYLVWLAIGALRHGSALTLAADAADRRPLGRVYLMGLGVNLLNPKIVMFFLTFLPQFVSVADPQAGAKLLFLGVYFTALGVPACAGLILAADHVVAALRRSTKVMRGFDLLFAGLMTAFAVKLLFSRVD